MSELPRERPDHEEPQLVELWAAPLSFPVIATAIYALVRSFEDLPLIGVLTIVVDVLGLFVPLMIAGWWCGRWSDRLTERLQVSPWPVLAALVILVDAGVAVLPWWVVQIGAVARMW